MGYIPNVGESRLENLSKYADLSSAITAIGASAPTTLLIDKDATVFEVSDNAVTLVVPANITLRFLAGNVLTLQGTGNFLRILGTIEAGLWQIFEPNSSETKTGNTSFPYNGKVLEVYPEWFGADSDKSAAVNTTAFSKAVSHMAPGSTMVIPAKQYQINTFVFDPGQSLEQITTGLRCHGKLICSVDGNGGWHTVVQIGNTTSERSHYKVEGLTVGYSGTTPHHGDMNIGVKVVNINHSDIGINWVANFHKGIEVIGENSKGNTVNTYRLGLVRNCELGLYIDAVTNGFVNSNTYIGGEIRYDSTFDHEDSVAVTITDSLGGAGEINGQRFIGPTLQCGYPETPTVFADAIKCAGHYAQFLWVYKEPALDFKIEFTSDSSHCSLFGGPFMAENDIYPEGAGETQTGDIVDSGLNNSIMTNDRWKTPGNYQRTKSIISSTSIGNTYGAVQEARHFEIAQNNPANKQDLWQVIFDDDYATAIAEIRVGGQGGEVYARYTTVLRCTGGVVTEQAVLHNDVNHCSIEVFASSQKATIRLVGSINYAIRGFAHIHVVGGGADTISIKGVKLALD